MWLFRRLRIPHGGEWVRTTEDSMSNAMHIHWVILVWFSRIFSCVHFQLCATLKFSPPTPLLSTWQWLAAQAGCYTSGEVTA